MDKNVLFVDDERAILRTCQRLLRADGLNVFTAEDGPAALRILAAEKIDIIISDVRMPGMDGHQLLRKVRDLYPATIRLMTSGHAEDAEIMKATLDGSCKMCVLKPWDSRELRNTIRQMLTVKEALQARQLTTVVDNMEGLRTSPPLYRKIMDLIDHDARMQEIAAAIEEDPVMTARVLQMVNAAFFGLKTGSVCQAIVYLGLTTLKNVILTASIHQLVPEGNKGPFNNRFFMDQASLTNRLFNILYPKLTGKPVEHVTASVGLLINIGRIVLCFGMPDKYAQMADIMESRSGACLNDVEQELLGVTYQEVGAYLLDWWNFPQQFIECALYHHDPFHENILDRKLVAAVHLANYFALERLNGSAYFVLDDRVFDYFQVAQEECEKLIQE